MPKIGLFLLHVDDVAFIIRDYASSISGNVLRDTTDFPFLGNVQLLSILGSSYNDNKFLSCCVIKLQQSQRSDHERLTPSIIWARQFALLVSGQGSSTRVESSLPSSCQY